MRRELGIRLVVHALAEEIHIHGWRNTENRIRAANCFVSDSENDSPAPSIGHANGHIHHQPRGIVEASPIPFLEIEILGFEFIRDSVLQLD
jgi:hypothetical protein